MTSEKLVSTFDLNVSVCLLAGKRKRVVMSNLICENVWEVFNSYTNVIMEESKL